MRPHPYIGVTWKDGVTSEDLRPAVGIVREDGDLRSTYKYGDRKTVAVFFTGAHSFEELKELANDVRIFLNKRHAAMVEAAKSATIASAVAQRLTGQP